MWDAAGWQRRKRADRACVHIGELMGLAVVRESLHLRHCWMAWRAVGGRSTAVGGGYSEGCALRNEGRA